MNVKISKTIKLHKKTIDNICKLKASFWKYSLRQHRTWFRNNINKNDLHFYCENKKKLLGYNSLRKKISLDNKKKINYFIFDTFIIEKNSRNQGLAKQIMKKNLNFLKKNKQIAFLQCEKKHIKFYKHLKWRILNKKKKIIKIKVRNNMRLMFVNFSNNNFLQKNF